jgi:L-threonylcarbamoyladenylate synthase
VKILSPDNIAEAVDLLKQGGVIVYPTETSYGIGCDATNAETVARVFAIKGRPEGKGVTLLLPSSNPFGEELVDWDPKLREMAEKYWPGPLNIIVEVRMGSSIATQCMTGSPVGRSTPEGSTIAVRRSSHPIAQALVDALGVPLVSTSANISGEKELYDAKSIVELFGARNLQPDAIIDAGLLKKNPPSTIITSQNGNVEVLRQGAITLEPSR